LFGVITSNIHIRLNQRMKRKALASQNLRYDTRTPRHFGIQNVRDLWCWTFKGLIQDGIELLTLDGIV